MKLEDLLHNYKYQLISTSSDDNEYEILIDGRKNTKKPFSFFKKFVDLSSDNMRYIFLQLMENMNLLIFQGKAFYGMGIKCETNCNRKPILLLELRKKHIISISKPTEL